MPGYYRSRGLSSGYSISPVPNASYTKTGGKTTCWTQSNTCSPLTVPSTRDVSPSAPLASERGADQDTGLIKSAIAGLMERVWASKPPGTAFSGAPQCFSGSIDSSHWPTDGGELRIVKAMVPVMPQSLCC